MKPYAVASPFSRPEHGTMPTPRGLFRLLIVTLCLSIAQTFAAVAQTTAPVPLPPAAQEALNKGIIAAKVPDYLLAIRYFEEARKLAPQAPVIYLNMGLAESRIPSRELRAMAWFGSYLAAYPEAPNATAVKEQIAVLEVRNQSNVSRLIKAVQDAANLISSQSNLLYQSDSVVYKVPQLWARAGDIATALMTADPIQDASLKSWTRSDIAEAQAEAGDIAGAQKTVADLIQDASHKDWAQSYIAKAQVKAGDIAGAQKTVDLIQTASRKGSAQIAIGTAQAKAGDIAGALKTAELIQDDAGNKSWAQAHIADVQAKAGDIADAQKTADLIQGVSQKDWAQSYIAEAQAKAGDIADAQKTADLIQDAGYKRVAQSHIAKAQVNAGITNAPNSTRQSTSDIQPIIRPAFTVSDWLKKLDNDLNTAPFLDLADYLKSLPPPDNPELVMFKDLDGHMTPLPPSGNPQRVFESLYKTAKKIVEAQNVITGMLKQQAKR